MRNISIFNDLREIAIITYIKCEVMKNGVIYWHRFWFLVLSSVYLNINVVK